MEEELLIGVQGKVVVLLALGYLCLRFSRYGAESIDRTVMQGAAALMLLAVGLYYATASSELLTVFFLVALMWTLAVIWLGRIPGLRIQLPEGQPRTYLYIEILAVAVIAFVAINLWE